MIFDPVMQEARRTLDKSLWKLGLPSIARIRRTVPLECVLPECAMAGVCPFCRGARFSIEAGGEFYACPDCGQAGDVITAYEQITGLTLVDALEELAHRVKTLH